MCTFDNSRWINSRSVISHYMDISCGVVSRIIFSYCSLSPRVYFHPASSHMAVLLTRHLLTWYPPTGSRSYLHYHQGSPGSRLKIAVINIIFGIWACLFIDNHIVWCVATLCNLLATRKLVIATATACFTASGATHPASVSAVHRNRLSHTSSRLI